MRTRMGENKVDWVTERKAAGAKDWTGMLECNVLRRSLILFVLKKWSIYWVAKCKHEIVSSATFCSSEPKLFMKQQTPPTSRITAYFACFWHCWNLKVGTEKVIFVLSQCLMPTMPPVPVLQTSLVKQQLESLHISVVRSELISLVKFLPVTLRQLRSSN